MSYTCSRSVSFLWTHVKQQLRHLKRTAGSLGGRGNVFELTYLSPLFLRRIIPCHESAVSPGIPEIRRAYHLALCTNQPYVQSDPLHVISTFYRNILCLFLLGNSPSLITHTPIQIPLLQLRLIVLISHNKPARRPTDAESPLPAIRSLH